MVVQTLMPLRIQEWRSGRIFATDKSLQGDSDTAMPLRIQEWRSGIMFTTIVIGWAVYTDQFVYAGIVPVIPFSLKGQAPESKIQHWVALLLGLFGVGCFVFSWPWGYWTDRCTSRRQPFFLGLFIILLATVLLWIAPYTGSANIGIQILGRILQGAASAAVWTIGMAALVDAVGHERIGEHAGYIGMALNGGSITAPVVGGVAYKRLGYHAVYGIIVGVIAIAFLLRLIMNEPQDSPPKTIVPATDTTTIGLEQEKRHGSIEKGPILEIQSVSSAASSRHSVPAMIRLLNSIRFCTSLWGVFVLAAIVSGFETVLPITVNEVFGWDSEGAGLIFLPLSAPALLGSFIGKCTDRFGGRWFAAVAFFLLCPFLVLMRLVDHDSFSQKVILVVLLVLVGCCLAVILEPIFSEIAFRAMEMEMEDKKAGIEMQGRGYYAQAYAHFNMAWSLGDAVGPFFAGYVVDSAGWKTATLSLGVLGGVTAIPMALWCGGWILRRKQQ